MSDDLLDGEVVFVLGEGNLRRESTLLLAVDFFFVGGGGESEGEGEEGELLLVRAFFWEEGEEEEDEEGEGVVVCLDSVWVLFVDGPGFLGGGLGLFTTLYL